MRRFNSCAACLAALCVVDCATATVVAIRDLYVAVAAAAMLRADLLGVVAHKQSAGSVQVSGVHVSPIWMVSRLKRVVIQIGHVSHRTLRSGPHPTVARSGSRSSCGWPGSIQSVDQ